MKRILFSLLALLAANVAQADLRVFATVPEWGALAKEIGGDKVKQIVTVKNGIESNNAKKIVKLVKDNKLKVQASIQGDAVRVTGAKKDDLQATMAMLRKEISEIPLEFNNFRN